MSLIRISTNNIGSKMRMTVLTLLLALAFTWIPDAFAQNGGLSVNMTNKTVSEVLEAVEQQSDYHFFYNSKLVNVNRPVTVKVSNKDIYAVLNALFNGTNVSYKVVDNDVILTTDAAGSRTASNKVNGIVVDAQGEPVIGANIVVKGKPSVGTITDINGAFVLPDAKTGDVLEVSYIGYTTQNVPVKGTSTMKIELFENLQSLDEVVVIGYGTVKKSDLTGAVASVNEKQFSAQPIKQASEALQGRMAGVVAQTYSGELGSGLNVRVRGVSSINFGNDPLWVVDGVIGAGITNPNDIESIEVLKDASSTAIYGSRGANGVVLVTTKQGEAGKPKIEVSGQFGFSRMGKKYDLMNPYEYARALSEMTTTVFTDDEMAAFENGTAGYDYYKLMLHTGVAQDYKVSISGGNEKNRYLVSGMYLDQTAITVASKLQRFGFRANMNSEVTKWLTVVTDLEGSTQKSHNTGADTFEMVNWSPIVPLTDENGVYYNDPYCSISNNPYGELLVDDKDSRSYNMKGNIDLRFKILDGLTFSTMGAFQFNNNSGYKFESSLEEANNTSEISNSMGRSINYQWTNNLTYTRAFGDHHLTATGVWEVYKTHYEGIGVSGENLLNELTSYWNINAIQSAISANIGYTDSQLLSAIGRVQYDYMNKYYLTASIRADGSSKFQKNKWGYFPSVGLGWNITRENFMQDQDVVQNLKLRGTFGVSGNQAISSYATLGALSLARYAYATGTLYPGYWQETLDAPNLTWETTTQYDLGVDASFLDQRLNVTIDWYRKNTKDMLFAKTIPMYAGGGTQWTNVGKMYSTGFEFTVNYVPIQTRDFTWSSTLTASTLKTKVTDLGGEEQLIPDAGKSGMRQGDAFIIKEGLPISNFHLWDFAGFDETGTTLYRTADGGVTNTPMDADRIITGNPIPKWTFGWNNSFQYKRWEANVFLRASTGFQRLNMIKYGLGTKMSQSLFIRSREAYYKNWDKVKDKSHAEYASMASTRNFVTPRSTQWLEDADFLRLQNLSLAYTFPKSVTKVADVSLGFSAQNLFTITGYSGYDPESTSSVSGDTVVGLDDETYPSPRTYTFTVKLTF